MSNVYLARYTPQNIIYYLYERDFNVSLIGPGGDVRDVISSHPDMFMCKMGVSHSSALIKSPAKTLTGKYPEYIAYNAVCLDKYFIHNLKYTAPELLEKAKAMGKTLIDVNQGYTKCNVAVVDGKSVITSDDGIYRTLSNYPDIDVLKITPGHIDLPGFDTGFIGGTCGVVDNTMLFCGDLSQHPDYYDILEFILRRDINVKFFDSMPLLDIGSIIESDF